MSHAEHLAGKKTALDRRKSRSKGAAEARGRVCRAARRQHGWSRGGQRRRCALPHRRAEGHEETRVALRERQPPYLSEGFPSAGRQMNKQVSALSEVTVLGGRCGVTVHALTASPKRGATEAVQSREKDLVPPPKMRR